MKEPNIILPASETLYSSTRDLGVLFEENEPTSQHMTLDYNNGNSHTDMNDGFVIQHMLSSRPLPPMRRARAGTMPSFANFSQQQSSLSPFHRALDRVSNGNNHDRPNPTTTGNRHRSGSLNLSTSSLHNPYYFGGGGRSNFNDSPWSSNTNVTQSRQTTQPPSPSTEQLLQSDSDFAIARTLRSIGLEDEHGLGDEEEDILLQQQRQLHNLLSTTSSTTNRSRSYSVNATSLYQESTSPSLNMDYTTAIMGSYASPLEEFALEQNRPRSSSMGLMESGGLPWSMRRSPLGMIDDRQIDLDDAQYQQQNGHYSHSLLARSGGMMNDNAISLGDTELLTNMLHPPSYNSNSNSNNSKTTDYTHDGYVDTQWSNEMPLMKLGHSTSSGLIDQHQQPTTVQATRSLWVGNIDGSITVDILTSLFSSFGPIESIRLLLEKECAFVNFFYTEDAIHAKDDVLSRLGGRIGNCIVRIGFGKADMAIPSEHLDLQPTRALWLGNIPGNTTPSTLHQLFSPFGAIESIRVLTQKKCGFINFETIESATAAKEALLNEDIGGSAFTNAGTKAGFAKVLPMKMSPSESSPLLTATTNGLTATKQGSHLATPSIATTKSKSSSLTLSSSSTSLSSMDNSQWSKELWSIMKVYGANDAAYKLVKGLDPSNYFDSIPPVPELGVNRKFDAGRLRDIRKRLDNLDYGNQEIDDLSMECMDEIAGLCSDYIGNTLVQRFFEKCSEDTKTLMLRQIGPHLASGGIHKNGTWAVQKIIDNIKTEEQTQLVVQYMKPYVPSLLLDQFGNYAVQCCLGMGSSSNQFIFDAMVEKQHYIAQGRFGARAMRGILDNELVTDDQRIFVAAALTQNVTSLATNPNGALIISWLIDSPKLNIPLQPISNRLVSQLVKLCTHKVGSQTILKLVNHERSTEGRDIVMRQLLNDDTALMDILIDQARGLGVVHKLILGTRHSGLATRVHDLLADNSASCYKKVKDDCLDILNSS
ncbi:armadillo-type protein [Chlamydoabsidia padenii]|nr:armadillo-type protein [Chlamydoabsidia padenii]